MSIWIKISNKGQKNHWQNDKENSFDELFVDIGRNLAPEMDSRSLIGTWWHFSKTFKCYDRDLVIENWYHVGMQNFF